VKAVIEFDRGTLLVRGLPSGGAIEGVPALWDERVGAHRARAVDLARLRRALERLPSRVEERVRPRPPDAAPSAWRRIELRPYQEAACDAFRLAGGRGVVVLPTGAGKTRLALAVMARCRRRSLCLVPTRALLEQWVRAVSDVYLGRTGCLGDGERRIEPVTIATFESGYRHMARIGNRFELLVIDEAHHFGSGLRDEALEMSAAAFRLGLTATPPRAGPAAARLEELVGPTVFDLVVSDLAGTYLAPFERVKLIVDLSEEERRAYDRWTELYRKPFAAFRRLHGAGSGAASWESFVATAAHTEEGRRAIAAWTRARRLLAYPAAKQRALRSLLERHRNERVIVFVGDNETAYRVSREHLIMPLTCDIRRRERAEALERFREGSLRALVSARVLNEGVDVPDAEVGVVVAGRLGEREHVQRVGRLLRPAEGKRAFVYELVVRASSEVGQAARRAGALYGRNPRTV
jgi:superfamily II DNA or RNA helicase